MREPERKADERGCFADALSRLAGAWLGALALWTTYVSGLLHGVQQQTVLVRAAVVGVIFFIAGRILGWFLGRSFIPRPARERAAPASDVETAP